MLHELFIGQQLMLKPGFTKDQGSVPSDYRKFPCEVVYINRKHRFFRVLFKFESGGQFFESYKF